jgi:hypothetical protein
VNATADAAAARETGNAPRLEGAALYRTLWRWHFYAGLWCIPFVILLACSGSLYLFKPQFEAWQDRVFESVAFAGPRIGAEAEVAKYASDDALDALHIAWAGGLEPGEGHYYRVHGPTLLAEYDNTQRGANHVHTVWRDPRHDFGVDALRAHYEHGHRH